jgi:aminoglycoside phosphotransferase
VDLAARTRKSTPALLDLVLSGSLGHGAVRRLAADPLGNGVAEVLEGSLPDAPSLTWELVRSKFKPSRKLTAYYRVSNTRPSEGTDPRSGGPQDLHVAVMWFAQRQPVLRVADTSAADRSVPRSALLGAASEDGRIAVRISPDDPVMPQLTRLTDPWHLAFLVGDLSGRPAVAPGQVTVDTIRYRPGQRHVLRVRLGGDAWVYVKTDRDCSGARAVETATFLRDRVADGAPGASVALPLGYAAKDSTALWWNVPGVPLSRQVTAQPAGALQSVALAGRALRVLHESPVGPPSLPRRSGPEGVQAEAEETLRAGEHVAVLLPAVGRTCQEVVSQVVAGLHRVAGEAPALNHGDFKSGNLLVDRGRLTILDLDRAAWADPAKDLGKFLVDLRWWCPDPVRAASLTSAFRAGYGPCDQSRWTRAVLFAALFQLKLTARRCAVHDPRWASHVHSGVGEAVEILRAVRGA